MATTNPKNKIANHNSDLALLLDEDTINLDLHPVEREEGQNQIEDCENYLELDGTPVDGANDYYVIARQAFVTLFKKAVKLPSIGNFVTALKIHLGCDESDPQNKKLCLIYTPVRLNDGKRVGLDNDFTYDEIAEGGPHLYLYDGISGNFIFAEISPEERDALTDAYKANIQILHSDDQGEVLSPFIPDLDTESLIFSFQEIFAIMYDYRLIDDYSLDIFTGLEAQPIYIFNCVKTETTSGRKMHSLLLSGDLFSAVFRDMYGNLAHLCPPHCKDLSYTLD